MKSSAEFSVAGHLLSGWQEEQCLLVVFLIKSMNSCPAAEIYYVFVLRIVLLILQIV